MPTVTRELMTPQEQLDFSQTMKEILIAQADGYCKLHLSTKPDGTSLIVNRNTPRGSRAEHLSQALDLAQTTLDEGKTTVTYKNRTPNLEPATVTKKYFYPIKHMTPKEETRFQEAVVQVNHGIMTRQCAFESDLDDEARIYFRYTILEKAQGRTGLLAHIDFIITQVRAGKILRIEMPGGGVILMPRWPLGTDPKN